MDVVRAFLGVKEKDEAEPPIGRTVVLAGWGTQPPLTEGKNGLFAKAVLDGLKGGADKDKHEGYEADGVVTVDEFTKYLDAEIPARALKIGKTAEERSQAPIIVARQSHYPLSRNFESAPKADEAVVEFKKRTAADNLAKDAADEGARYLARMPKLKAQQDLRKTYQQYAAGKATAEQVAAARQKMLEGSKMSADEAHQYAEKLYTGLAWFQGVYIKPLKMEDIVAKAVTGLYRRVEEKVPDALKERLDKTRVLNGEGVIELLADARQPLGKREDLEKDKDVDLSMKAAMYKLVDDYSMYVDKDQVEEFNKSTKGNFRGIGVQIRRDIVQDGLLVVTPILGSPAYKAGMQQGDLIVSIKQEVDNEGTPLPEPKVVSTKSMKVQDAVKLILGKPGTKVKVTIKREVDGKPVEKELEIERAVVQTESVFGWKRNKDDSWDYYVDPANKIAYMYLSQFAEKSFDDMEKAVRQLAKDGVKGLVLDLRFNPGGYLHIARDICDLFIDDGQIVSVRPRNDLAKEEVISGFRKTIIRDDDGKPVGSFDSYTDFPMAILINGESAGQRDHGGLPARLRPSGDRRRAELRQGERPADVRHQVHPRRAQARRPTEADHGDVLAAERQEPEQVEHRRQAGRGLGRTAEQGLRPEDRRRRDPATDGATAREAAPDPAQRCRAQGRPEGEAVQGPATRLGPRIPPGPDQARGVAADGEEGQGGMTGPGRRVASLESPARFRRPDSPARPLAALHTPRPHPLAPAGPLYSAGFVCPFSPGATIDSSSARTHLTREGSRGRPPTRRTPTVLIAGRDLAAMTRFRLVRLTLLSALVLAPGCQSSSQCGDSQPGFFTRLRNHFNNCGGGCGGCGGSSGPAYASPVVGVPVSTTGGVGGCDSCGTGAGGPMLIPPSGGVPIMPAPGRIPPAGIRDVPGKEFDPLDKTGYKPGKTATEVRPVGGM